MTNSALARFRPEISAGGFTRDDGTIEFYLRVRSLLKRTDIILDLGAGRGAQHNADRPEFLRNLRTIRGNVAKFVGADVDTAVMDNPSVDEAIVIEAHKPLPFKESTFDLIISDWVLEHVEDANTYAREVRRILKPGGWFCARTPSKHAYFAIGGRLLPNWLEGHVLKRVQPGRRSADVFPKHYFLNSRREIRKAFDGAAWELISYYDNPPPAYTGGSSALFRTMELYQSLVPSVILIFARKRM